MSKGKVKYAQEMKDIANIDIQQANGEFKSTYQILSELGEVWDKLSSVDKATLGNDLFGNDVFAEVKLSKIGES